MAVRGQLLTDNPKVYTTTIRLDNVMRDKLYDICDRKHQSICQFVTICIEKEYRRLHNNSEVVK